MNEHYKTVKCNVNNFNVPKHLGCPASFSKAEPVFPGLVQIPFSIIEKNDSSLREQSNKQKLT